MPPKISVKSAGKAGSRKKGEDADAGYKKVSFGSLALLWNSFSCTWSVREAYAGTQGSTSTAAPRRAKRANSSKRFRDEDEGYEEAYAEVTKS